MNIENLKLTDAVAVYNHRYISCFSVKKKDTTYVRGRNAFTTVAGKMAQLKTFIHDILMETARKK